MKVSIWQQFSSNHSASFMIVGQFKTVEKAESVASEVRQMIREIGSWWEQVEDSEAVRKRLESSEDVTPPERRFASHYEVSWSQNARSKSVAPLDWISHQAADSAVRTFNSIVIVEPVDSWQGPHPIDKIIEKLGAQVASDCEIYDSYLSLHLSCTAPDQAIADQIMAKIEYKQLSRDTVMMLPGLYATRGRALCDGKNIILTGYQMHRIYHSQQNEQWAFEEELRRLLEFFTQCGCTDIQYTFSETSSSEEP